MTAGQTYSVSITMTNSGNTTWTAASMYRLGYPNNGTIWGLSRVELPASVPVGTDVTFSFNVTAPTTPGPYSFMWQMIEENVHWFGDVTPSVNVSVRKGDDAAFITQSVPATMAAGQAYSVSVTMQNTGGNPWTPATVYHLASDNPADNTTWGLNRVNLPTDPVNPDVQAPFTFTVTAPKTAGTYPFQWGMIHDSVGRFGTDSTNVNIAVSRVTPVISSLSPSKRLVNSGNFTLTVNGTDFNPDAIVKWNGAAETTTFGSSTQLNAAISSSLLTSAGSVSITVTNPQVATSAPATLILSGPPVISSLSPGGQLVNGNAFTLTVNGSGFTSDAIVKWNGASEPTTFVSSTQLTASIPASLLTSAGTESITVTDPSLATSDPAPFTVSGVPTISSLSPATVTAGTGAFTFTVNGTNFNSDAVVEWNGTGEPTTFVSSSQLTVSIASSLNVVGVNNVMEVNPHVNHTDPATFTVYPNFTFSISPNSVLGGASATGTVTLIGGSAPSTMKMRFTSDQGAVPAPGILSIASGSSSGTVTLTTSNVSSSVTANITANNSNTTLTQTLTVNPFAAPTNLTATPGNNQVLLAWTGSAGATGYNVYRGTSQGLEDLTNPLNGSTPLASTVSTFHDTTAINGTPYFYVVRAVNSGGESPSSNEATTTPTGQTAPTGLTAVATGSGKITLYWTGIPGASGYNIYMGTVQGQEGTTPINSKPVTTVDSGPGLVNVYMYTKTGLTNGTEYFFIVTALYGATESAPSNEDSSIPSASAIPWDTSDPNQIVQSMNQLLTNTLPPDYFDDGTSESIGYLTIGGPDGVVYQGNIPDGSPSRAVAASGHYDSDDNTIRYSDGTIAPATSDGNDPSGQPSQAKSRYTLAPYVSQGPPVFSYPGYAPNPTGIFRKVETKAGYSGFRALLGLPLPGDTGLTLNNSGSQPDAAYIYSGGQLSPKPGVQYRGGRTLDLDIGLQLGHSDPTTNPGWKPFILYTGNALESEIVDGSALSMGVTVFIKGDPLDGENMFFYSSGVLSAAATTPAQSVATDNLVVLRLIGPYVYRKQVTPGFNVDSNYTGAVTCTYFASGWSKFYPGSGGHASTNQKNFILKRTNSIGQTLHNPRVNPATNAPYPRQPGTVDPNGPPGVAALQAGFYTSGSSIIGATWGTTDDQSIQVFNGSGWQSWQDDQTLVDAQGLVHSGSYPNLSRYVDWITQNDFFFETGINLQTRP